MTQSLKLKSLPLQATVLLTMLNSGSALLLTVLLFLFRAPPIDDAYITFRYAVRLAELGTFSWNDHGAPVLGTTTVLWTILLSGLYRLQVASIEHSALAATTLIVFILLYSLISVAERLIRTSGFRQSYLLSLLIVSLTVLNVPVRISLFSGMETALYCLLVLQMIISLPAHGARAGCCAGLAALTRPDGVLLAMVGVLFSPKRQSLRFIAACSVMVMPWGIYSILHFGQLIPGSVTAKQLLYPSPWLKNFLIIFEAHSQTPLQAILFCTAGAGLAAAVTFPSLRPFLLWLPLYGAGITLSGVKPLFFWYFTPSWLFGAFVGLVAGLCWLKKQQRVSVNVLTLSLVVATTSVGLHSFRQEVSVEGGFLREHVYRDIVTRYRPKMRPGDTILVGETGILGFGFLDHTVIDSAGITSLEVRALLRDLRDKAGPEHRYHELATIPGWSKVLISTFNPTWIIAARYRFDLTALEKDPAFAARYERKMLYIPNHLGGIGVYRARDLE